MDDILCYKYFLVFKAYENYCKHKCYNEFFLENTLGLNFGNWRELLNFEPLDLGGYSLCLVLV